MSRSDLVSRAVAFLYKWIEAVKSDKTDKQAVGLIEAVGEVLKQGPQSRRTEEEGDTTERPREKVPTSPSKASLQQ